MVAFFFALGIPNGVFWNSTCRFLSSGKEKGIVMLVLSRKIGERIWIGENISVTVVRITGGGVRLGIEAPPELPVVREELKAKIESADSESPEEEDNSNSTIKFPTT